MFEVPEAKRVRREDLDKSDDGADNWSDDGIRDAELRAKLNAQIARSLGLEILAEPPPEVAMKDCSLTGGKESGDDDIGDSEAIPAAEDDQEEEFVFRLFSKAPPSQKVVLEEDPGPTGDGTFVSGRPLTYYVVKNISAERKHEYAVAAVSGDQVLARSHGRAWGLEVPWKVTKLAITRKARANKKAQDEVAQRKRPGKKQRISLRKRAKEREERKAAEVKKMAEKEEHVKDKKKRMNRLKKLRKRAKAKGQKQALKEEDGDNDSNADSSASE
ncbi:hypothetical protein DER46DRAFT_595645 [Fusarium sp. MPI-SDFR-AT-0072]|uniref:Uncharacterized protein n=1 Tax=Fusarium oxysporum f. sp. rapae TaxID=485398 RepID=A0A8J5P306_FUSOX|nr:hypothetical protein Forpe1208_v002499 [Fusarium oxysporum f. sp. rapae]KAH7172543.1 hypothetical protein DER46DRAFT_595645 [Fusarium sp. MPI-SDFR-AT-0072]KAI7768643.1 hypothetical protein LZL87_000190 [Fusarium oxysporum]